MNSKIFALALAAAAGSTAAFAAPQEVLNYVAANGGSPLIGTAVLNGAGNSIVTVPAVGAYTTRSIRLQGNISTILAASYGTETRIQVTTPGGAQVVFGPFLNHGSGSSAFAPVAFDRTANIAATGAAGNWTVQTYETFNDTGDDAFYDQLTVTLDDAEHKPASFIDLGDLASSASSLSQPVTLTSASHVQWFRATLPAVAAGGSGYVDMWLTPVNNPFTTTDLTSSDMAVYADATNALITVDTVDGPASEPQVSYGSTVSRGTTTFGTMAAGVARDGRDGALAGGVYWVAVTHSAIVAPALGYNVSATNGATTQSTGILEIRTNPNTAPTPPSVASGASSPANGPAGGSRILTCVVSPGANPSSAISTVLADLTSVGGPASASFNDSGLSGDATAGDGIYSYALASATGTPGNVTVTATDALARSGSGTIAVNFFNAIALGDYSTGSHTTNVVADNVTGNGGIIWYAVNLPAVSGAGAGFVDIWTEPTADPIPATDMGDTELGLYDPSGALVTADDDDGAGLWTALSFGSTTARSTPTFPNLAGGVAFNGRDGSLSGGLYYLAVGRFNVTYGATGFGATSAYVGTQSQTRVHFNTLDNTAPTSPSILATSATVVGGGLPTSGSTFLLTATVTPGTNPASTGITVTGDTTSIGGGPGAVFLDNGLNGDAASGDGIYSLQLVATGSGTNAVPLAVADLESRSGSGNINVNFVTVMDAGIIAGTDNDPNTADVITGTHTQVLGQISWMKFTLAAAVQDDGDTGLPGTWLDIDTEGTGADGLVVGSLADTYIGIYNDAGNRVDGLFIGADDDSGTYYRSQLTFGDVAPVRPGIVSADTLDTGLVGDGSNGNLAVGTYYLALGNFACTMGTTNFGATTTNTTAAGDYTVNFRTNLPSAGPAQCSPADVGVQGGGPGQDNLLNNNDFIAFIDLFFANAPTADLGSQGGVPGADGQWNNNDFIVFIDYFFNDAALCQG